MTLNIARETAALGRLSITELRQRFVELFGEPTRLILGDRGGRGGSKRRSASLANSAMR